MLKTTLVAFFPLLALSACASTPKAASTSPADAPLYSPDLGNGSYQNPILFADYSDPDVLRVGDDYYLTASSFTCFPGLPILHSKDLVNWTIVGHAIEKYPLPGFDRHINGAGVWAPSMRYHNGEYYIIFGDPDFGVFMTKTKNPAGPWEPLVCMKQVKGWIDTCPLWDDDGNAYLVHAYAGSRAGRRNNMLDVCKISPDATKILDDGQHVFDGKANKFTTIEGPKFYKRNGYYYIFTPGGGVSGGYQVICRSKNVYGPYESKVVLHQGKTSVNGPHQGAWVTTQTGQDWFIHFTDAGAFGRITELEPMRWADDWPVMGVNQDKNGIGEPVLTYKKPDVGASKPFPIEVPQTSDEFATPTLGLQWQWFGNYQENWISLSARPGFLRMYPVSTAQPLTLFQHANLLLQKFPCDHFTATARLDASALGDGNTAGFLVTGTGTAALEVQKTGAGLRIVRTTTDKPLPRKHLKKIPPDAPFGDPSTDFSAPTDSENLGAPSADAHSPIVTGPAATQPQPAPRDVERDAAVIPGTTTVYLQISVERGPVAKKKDALPTAKCTLRYSIDGKTFIDLGEPFVVEQNGWIGAKLGLFCNGPDGAQKTTSTNYADVDWFRFTRS